MHTSVQECYFSVREPYGAHEIYFGVHKKKIETSTRYVLVADYKLKKGLFYW